MELGELGEGFPILFRLMYYINCLLFLILVFFFLPAMYTIDKAIVKYGDLA